MFCSLLVPAGSLTNQGLPSLFLPTRPREGLHEVDMLVSAQWLAQHPEARVIDLRWPKGREKYDQGHLPGAAFVDLDRDLSQPGGPGRHPLPSEESFRGLVSRLGIDPDTHVVVYDEGPGAIAARLWFMLRIAGHERVSLLDGGLKAWAEVGLPVTQDVVPIAPAARRTLSFDPSRIVDRRQVETRGDTPVLDARAAERYRGETEPLDKRAGHIPGALNAPYAHNLDATGRFRKSADLYEQYRGYAAPILSCGSGVTACHDAFAIELAGLPPARVYVGSWSDWSSDPSRPIAIGADPG
jgi:thiosulfate/3-mercaptopyruvate sulfurtransferase